jgi:hypothetical protein
VTLNNVKTTHELPQAEAAESFVHNLADVIDREFARREPTSPTPYDYAAAQLGVTVADLVVLSEEVEPLVADSVGCWLLDAHQRHAAPHTGAHPARPASSAQVEGAEGDVHGFQSATVTLPAGALHSAPVVLRIAPNRFQTDVELMGRRQDADGLSTVFAAFLHTRRTSGSPYYRGAYRVDTSNAGVILKRWAAPTASRDLLKLDDSVWETVDRSVHRVLELADDLTARGLGTSSGVLLVGPPGTGKTQLGTVIASELAGQTTVLVPGTYVVEHYLTELFDVAANLSPCLVLMDDLDLVAGERGHTNPHRLREFLNVMDGGLADRSGVVVVASTNDHKKVDKAAQRSSRFDTIIKMEAPSLEGRLAILQRYLSWCDAELDLPAIARATEGATGADLKELVRRTVLETNDDVTTSALLTAACHGRWQSASAPAGVYL